MEKVEIGYNRRENELKACRQEESNLESQLKDIAEKLEEMENNKRNNLIFYGILNDPYESHASLHQKVSDKNTDFNYFIELLNGLKRHEMQIKNSVHFRL